MINKKLIAATLLSSVAVLGMATSASAETTEGSIIFDANKDGTLLQPGTPDVLIKSTEGKTSLAGSTLRFEFVPNINFGSVTSGVGVKEYKARTIEFTKVNDATPGKKYYIPPFLQVGDDRQAGMQWSVDVNATVFKDDGNTSTLPTSYMAIRGQKLHNSVYDEGGAMTTAGTMEGATLAAGAGGAMEAKIPTDANKVRVLSTKAGQSTYLTKASNVFDSAYTKTKSDDGTYKAEGEIDGIVFHKPNADLPDVNKQYKSVITWTLNDSL